MNLAEDQPRKRIFIECTLNELSILPKPVHVIDYQTGTLLVEFERTTITIVALRLCGLNVTHRDIEQ